MRAPWCSCTAAGRLAAPGPAPLPPWPSEAGKRSPSIFRGHGESDWSSDDDRVVTFADDVREVLRRLPPNPVLVGASLGGFTSMLLVGELAPGIAGAVVLVDIVPDMNPSGAARIHDFMADRMVEGFDSLDEVADMIAEYNPHRCTAHRSEWLARQPASPR